MYLKRHQVPKSWPITRKGTTYVVRANFNNGIPILVFMRDLLKLAKTRKEVKKIIHLKYLLVNGKQVLNEKNSVGLFDIVTLVPSKKSYKIVLSDKGIFSAIEIKSSETHQKISKIIGKKILRGKKVQLNLSDGRNFISNIKCNVNDSAIIDFKENKIKKCIPLKEKNKVIVFAGKHAGSEGVIDKINLKEKMAELKVGKEKVHVLIKHMMVTE